MNVKLNKRDQTLTWSGLPGHDLFVRPRESYTKYPWFATQTYQGEHAEILASLLKHEFSDSMLHVDYNSVICYRSGTDTVYKTTLFLFAIRFGSFEQIFWLLKHGGDKMRSRRSAIEIAIASERNDGVIEIVEDFIH